MAAGGQVVVLCGWFVGVVYWAKLASAVLFLYTT